MLSDGPSQGAVCTTYAKMLQSSIFPKLVSHWPRKFHKIRKNYYIGCDQFEKHGLGTFELCYVTVFFVVFLEAYKSVFRKTVTVRENRVTRHTKLVITKL